MGSSNENSAYGPVHNPARPRPRPRRLQRRLRRRRRRRHGRRDPRHRHRRLHPPARRVLRSRRRSAHLRPRLPLRPHRLRLVPRPHRPAHQHRRRRRHGPLGHRRIRSPRRHLVPEPVPDYAAELAKPVKGLNIGVPAEYFAEGLDPEVRAAVEAAIEKLRADGCRDSPHLAPAHPLRRARLLRPRDRRGKLQPRPLRRRPLRLSRPRRQHPLRHVPKIPRRRLRRRGQAPHPAWEPTP